jgi:hypothetical protein
MFKPFTKKAGKKGATKKAGATKHPFPPKKAGGGVPSGGMPDEAADEAALDARIGRTFRGGNPGGGKSLPSRPPWA